MGVRGLTGYVARHAELYLTPYELHDCNLVIDGDNLACNLYKDVTGTYSAFGGDYDDYFRSVTQFFAVLKECNIRPYVLMDGGYEHRKLRTVGQRLRGKIAVIKRINPCGSIPVFPIFMKEVFLDAVRHCSVPVMRCLFEADDELAALGRKLNCPVLSYDSDFYIHNVPYIPLITLTVKAHVKRIKAKNNNESQEGKRRLYKKEARNVEKRTKAHCILNGIHRESVNSHSLKNRKGYKYMDCCIYRIENLIARGALSKEKLPIFAALLGNDYIQRSAFRNFFAVGMGRVGRSRKTKQQQRRIRVVLQWLKNETAETALQKILTRLKKNQREVLERQVKEATTGYLNEECLSYDYFVNNYGNVNGDVVRGADENEYQFSDEDEQTNDAEYVEEDEIESDVDCVDEIQDDDIESEISSENNSKNEIFEKTDSNASDECNIHISKAKANTANEQAVKTQNLNEDEKNKIIKLPSWFLERFRTAQLPRFFCDLLYLKKYINNPQIEHFPYDDAHQIALPILIYIFTLLNSVTETDLQAGECETSAHNNKLSAEFTYLTRAKLITDIRYYRYAADQSLNVRFNPVNIDLLLFRKIFEAKFKFSTNVLFEKIISLPDDLQLYFLSIVYWLHKSQHCNLLHLYALIISLTVLRTVDSKIASERDLRQFEKRFGKIIKKERIVRATKDLQGAQRNMRENLKNMPILERITHVPKSDCYLVQDNMLKHFHLQEIFKKKYDSFSTTVLHGFAEFQSVAYQLYSLNALLEFPFAGCEMGKLYCGVFLYNLYDLLHARPDVNYYVKNFIFQDSQMMYEFYCYLFNWCEPFVPQCKQKLASETNIRTKSTSTSTNKKFKRHKQTISDKNTQVDSTDGLLDTKSVGKEDNEFFDLNNKFSAFFKIE